MSFEMKTKHDNDLIDYTSAVYAKNDIELSWPIGSVVDCDENHVGKQHD